ncbi:tyrosine-type recombinase/integrase [Paenibacillus sp. MCAF9]|uniref:tyrosine-type recombinase/integrase n=1 Tax=Paenibacillus sp. MCAF9 TaxID=3233046 RepID=UPI003F9D187C
MSTLIINGIPWSVNSVNEVLHPNDSIYQTNKKNEYERIFEIAPGIFFHDNYWDFSNFDKLHRKPFLYRYDFTDIKNISYSVFLKRMILRQAFHHQSRFSSVKVSYSDSREFILYLLVENIISHTLINEDVLKTYVELKSHLSENTKRRMLGNIKRLFIELEYEDEDKFKVSNFDFILKDFDLWQIKSERENGKTPNVPRSLFNKIIQFALNDMRNSDLSIIYRMFACIILLFSQIGMRKGEAILLEIDRLHEISILNGEKKAYFLEFLTYKTSASKDGKWTETRMNDISMEAYCTLENLTIDRRKNGSKALYANPASIDGFYSASTLDKQLHLFFIRHQKALDCDSLDEHDLKKVKYFRIMNRHIRTYRFINKEDEGKKFYHISFHQFRVAVANDLRDAGVSLEWIKKHMNHLEEDMTKHYFRDDKVTKEALFSRASKDNGLLEINHENIDNLEILKEIEDPIFKEAYETINNYLKKKKLNIFKNIDEIIKLFKNSPIRETELGLCTKAMGLLCSRQDRLTTMEKWYYLRPQFIEISNFYSTYNRFIEKAKIVEHNRQVAVKDLLYQRQYDLELKSFKTFVENKYYPELMMLKNQLSELGEERVMEKFPNLSDIISRFDKVEKESQNWVMKLIT